MKFYFILIALLISNIYSQCSNYTSMDCNSSSNCEWVEDISYASCSSLGTSNSSFCDAQPNCNYSWLTYSCGGGSYEVDNSYCQEIEILECFDLTHGPCMNDDGCEWVGAQNGYCQDFIISECDDINESNCNNNDYCNWVEEINVSHCNNFNSSSSCGEGESCTWVQDIDTGWCGGLNSSSCGQLPGCYWSCMGGFYLGNCYGTYGCGGTYQIDNSYCGGGDYEIDNSYCEEIQIIECSEMDELGCNGDDSCDWVEDIQFGSCNGNSSTQCNTNQNCGWVNNIVYGSCSSMSGMGECDATPGCSYSTLTYTCGGSYIISDNSYCGGGNYEIDNSYCEEIELLECSQYNEWQCSTDHSCNWVNDYYWDNCSNYNSSTSCYAANSNGGNCNWSWNSTLWQDTCSGGSFQVDNSYCQENPNPPDCSELNENHCNHPEYGEGCDWVENIETENCHDILDCTGGCTWQDCEAIEGCWWHFGTAYYDPSGCYGEHEADNSYCEDVEYLLGDATGDFSINVLDVIQIVNFILDSGYNTMVDMNYDNQLNVLDVILVVDIILGN